MSGPVIIRLQNLPLEARSIDIRRFFEGLMIPDGGVHIIGGERGDAFIAFHSDEDARQAMGRDMYPLCGSKIRLFLSSKTEMQNVIASARQAPAAAPKPASNPLDFLLKSVVQPQQQVQSSAQLNANKISQLTSTINPNILDQLKNINTIFPNLTQQQPVAPKVEEPKPNVSIDQILNILQTHLQPGQQKQSEKAPSPDQSRNNRYNTNQYNTDRSSGEINSYKSNSSSQQRYDPRTNNSTNSYSTSKYNSESSNSYGNNNNNNRREAYGNNSSESRYPAKYQSNDQQASGGHRTLDPIIKVRNFNTNCSYKDVRTFLQGIQIEHDGIKLLADFNNQRNGQAFVKLMSITDLKKALCRNKQFYEDRNIVVTQSSESEFNTAANVYTFGPNNGANRNNNTNNSNAIQNKKIQDNKSQMSSSDANMGENGFFLKIYGLPVQFDESELKTMFNNVNFIRFTTATPTPITSTSINNGVEETTTSLKAKKLCQVETQLDLERALTRQDERVGKSKLQIFQISKQEYDREIAHAEKYANRYNNGSNGNGVRKYSNGGSYDSHMSDDLFVHMSGVPLDAAEDDIRGFFQDINLIGNLVVTDAFKNPVGEVCCYFATKQDTERALELNDQLFMDRNVSVKPLKYSEYHMIAQKQLMGRLSENRRRALLGDAPETFAQVLQGRSYNGNSSQNSNDGDEEGRFGNGKTGNGPMNLMSLNGNYKRKNLPDNGNNQMKRIKSNHNEDSNSSPNSQALPPLPAEFAKYRNRLILISNINYDASREDILELVSHFSPLEQTLKIRHDDQGRPAGDAVIAFQASEDADEAVDHLDGSEFMGESLRATLFSSA